MISMAKELGQAADKFKKDFIKAQTIGKEANKSVTDLYRLFHK
jgi:hypothetical protein